MEIDQPKTSYFFDGVRDQAIPEELVSAINSFLRTENLYLSAVREISTKLENLNNEFKYTKDRNPIHQIKTRVKTPASIMQKLKRMGREMTVESAQKHLNDIAGVRVICPYIDDIYMIASMLTSQSDVTLVRTRDYIKDPKPNGYRSLHLIVEVPVFLSDGTADVKVEVQIRTIAMDFWASLEHELAYKFKDGKIPELEAELKSCADVIADTDSRMQRLYSVIHQKKNGPDF